MRSAYRLHARCHCSVCSTDGFHTCVPPIELWDKKTPYLPTLQTITVSPITVPENVLTWIAKDIVILLLIDQVVTS